MLDMQEVAGSSPVSPTNTQVEHETAITGGLALSAVSDERRQDGSHHGRGVKAEGSRPLTRGG
jgi:hypothetical protein